MLDGKWLDMRIEYVRDKIESFGIYWDLLRSSWTLDLYTHGKTLHHSLSQHVVEWLDGAAAVSVLKQRPWWLRHGQRCVMITTSSWAYGALQLPRLGRRGGEKEGEPPVLSSLTMRCLKIFLGCLRLSYDMWHSALEVRVTYNAGFSSGNDSWQCLPIWPYSTRISIPTIPPLIFEVTVSLH